MPGLTTPIITLLALAGLAAQTAPTVESTRARLEDQRRALLTMLADPNWMRETGRATVARLQIQYGWKECAENEALALTGTSRKPARLLAEAALGRCRAWQEALELALANGAYPYLDGAGTSLGVSREDMVATAGLDARDAAMALLLAGRGAVSDTGAPDTGQEAASRSSPAPENPPSPGAKQAAPATDSDVDEETVIVVVGRRGGCRVRLADRTLTEKELAAKAREWTAKGIALKLVRPRGADYRCMAKIAFQLGEQGLRLFEFVEADLAPTTRP
ncbi:MAG: hypothetical protein EOP61_01415 [Sphingomonadales bacterium]|nr:MAG: hypothetical protein EOP61_01415 [Sphingomonadales bacterium]